MVLPRVSSKESRVLEVRELSAGYGNVHVLRGVDLDVAEGEIVALLGSNGAGKSTLNNVLSGICPPFAGSVRFGGEAIHDATPMRVVELGLVQVPEGRRIFPNLSVRENLELGSFRRGRARRDHNLARVTAIFPRLAERAGQPAGSLSGGEQQMLAIGRGLMSEPKLLVLDEPSLGLSPLLVEDMFALIKRINGEGLAVLLVEQNVVQSLAIAHRAYVLENGRIALAGNAAELADNPRLKRSFLGL
jgi:branched-chain amino acid transport system ATP-binding protein